MSRIEKRGNFLKDSQLQRCDESGTYRICVFRAFHGLSMALRDVSLFVFGNLKGERMKLVSLIGMVAFAMLSQVVKSATYEEIRQRLDAVKAKMAAEQQQNQMLQEQAGFIEDVNQCFWIARAMSAKPDEIKKELENVEKALRKLNDLRCQQLDDVQWAETDQRIDRIRNSRLSRVHSPARKRRTLHKLDLQIERLEKKQEVLRGLLDGSIKPLVRENKNLPCKSLCGYEFGKCYMQDGPEEDVALKKSFRHLGRARLGHDSAKHLISVELYGELPKSDRLFVVDELIKCIMVFEDQYGVRFPFFTNCLTTSTVKDDKCFSITLAGNGLSCKVNVVDPENRPQNDTIPEGVGADVL